MILSLLNGNICPADWRAQHHIIHGIDTVFVFLWSISIETQIDLFSKRMRMYNIQTV